MIAGDARVNQDGPVLVGASAVLRLILLHLVY